MKYRNNLNNLNEISHEVLKCPYFYLNNLGAIFRIGCYYKSDRNSSYSARHSQWHLNWRNHPCVIVWVWFQHFHRVENVIIVVVYAKIQQIILWHGMKFESYNQQSSPPMTNKRWPSEMREWYARTFFRFGPLIQRTMRGSNLKGMLSVWI